MQILSLILPILLLSQQIACLAVELVSVQSLEDPATAFFA